MLQNNPLFANNPQFREMMPAMLQQLQNPEMRTAMSNPQVLQVMPCDLHLFCYLLCLV